MSDSPDFFQPVGDHLNDTTLSSVETLVIPAGATWLLIQALGANVRYTLSGTTPSASVGFQLKNGNPPIKIPVRTGMTIKLIQEASGGIIQYQFLG